MQKLNLKIHKFSYSQSNSCYIFCFQKKKKFNAFKNDKMHLGTPFLIALNEEWKKVCCNKRKIKQTKHPKREQNSESEHNGNVKIIRAIHCCIVNSCTFCKEKKKLKNVLWSRHIVCNPTVADYGERKTHWKNTIGASAPTAAAATTTNCVICSAFISFLFRGIHFYQQQYSLVWFSRYTQTDGQTDRQWNNVYSFWVKKSVLEVGKNPKIWLIINIINRAS